MPMKSSLPTTTRTQGGIARSFDATVIEPGEEWAPLSHPGEILLLDFLKPAGISQYRLAKSTGLSQVHVSELVHGKRPISAQVSLRLGKFLRVRPDFWLRLQADYDICQAQQTNAEALAKIEPFQMPHPATAQSK